MRRTYHELLKVPNNFKKPVTITSFENCETIFEGEIQGTSLADFVLCLQKLTNASYTFQESMTGKYFNPLAVKIVAEDDIKDLDNEIPYNVGYILSPTPSHNSKNNESIFIEIFKDDINGDVGYKLCIFGIEDKPYEENMFKLQKEIVKVLGNSKYEIKSDFPNSQTIAEEFE